MRRSHAETAELISARTADFVNGDASEYVLAASLKALHLSPDEVRYWTWRAKVARTHALKERENG